MVRVGGGGGKCSGWCFRVYALAWVFRNKLSTLLVPNHWGKKCCPSVYKCCVHPLAAWEVQSRNTISS